MAIGDVVDWLNSQWLTADDAELPPCWPDHPDLCQWLPAVAAARYEVGYGVTPVAVRDWIALWYPEVVGRSTRLTRCRLGGHRRNS
ncbi:hypothetical protein [Nocardioides sp. GY 10127]|uniref:hypothetical protein n=1 Tax=Nocardioides sp. GY 10127 TaxID=2569762 RepID=UPI0010A8973D|nr:hypothetical protein [Nocardioides sp. GY 10127]TIC79005.1 hypothetical protein E8D37_18455 [Nocardioides sp. GY 10127]